MRLFVAINFSPETRSGLLALRDELRSRSEAGNFTVPENIHLTLVFLGECDIKEVGVIQSAMDAVNLAEFQLNIDRLGRFKRPDGDIWWAGVQESKPLMQLQKDISIKLGDAGFAQEKRKYSPHITLARRVASAATPWPITPFGETVSSIELMISERINGKLTYSAMYSKKAN